MTDRVQRNSLMDSIGPRGLQNDNVENCYWILRDAQDDECSEGAAEPL